MGGDALSAGAVARRLGVAVTTLRTWHRRYGLGPSGHVPGAHRRYTPTDLARLEIMRRLTAQGVNPAEAASWARGTRAPDAPCGGEPTAATARSGDATAGGGEATADGGEPAAATTAGPGPAPVGAGSGSSTPRTGWGGPAARGLARAAMRLDATGMMSVLRRSLAAHGVIATWEKLLRPVLAGIGERHAATAGLIEVEHLLSRCASEALATVPRPADGEPSRILLACADEEQHTLPLEALAAALAEAGVGCRLLGARVPMPALLRAVDRTGPAVVGLWSHAPATADPTHLDALLSGRHRPLLVLAAGPGWSATPGWSAARLLPGVASPADLAQAVSVAIAVVEPLIAPRPGAP